MKLLHSTGTFNAARRAVLGALLLFVQLATVWAEDPGTEWEKLNTAVSAAFSRGAYDEGAVLAKQALDLATATFGWRDPRTLTSLKNLAFLHESQQRYGEAEPLYEQALQLSREMLGETHPETLASLNNLAFLHESQGRYGKAEPLYEQALRLRREVLGETHPDTLASLNNLAFLYARQGQYAAAEPLYEQALQLSREVLGDKHPDTLISLNNLAGLYERQGRYSEAEPLFEQALQLRREVLGETHPQTLTSLNSLAGLYESQGRYDEAEPLFEQALQLRREVLGETHPETLASLNNLAGLYESQGRYGDAEPLYEEALRLRREVLGETHPDTLASLNNLAALYERQGRYDEAEPLYAQALRLHREVLGETHPQTLTSLNNLAGLYRNQGRYGDAEPLYEEALRLRRKVLGDKHPRTLTSINNLAGLYESQGRYGEAEPLYEQALQLRREVLGETHPDTLASLNNLAVLYWATGRYAAAVPLLERALAIREKALGPEHPDLATSLSNLAWLYREQGQYPEALDHMRKATAISRGRAVQSSTRRSIGGQAELASVQGLFWAHAAIAAEYAEERPDQRTALAAEAFAAGQLARATGTANAVSRMAARFAAGSDALARAVREQQDLVARWRAYNTALIEAVSRPPEERARDAEERLRRELDDVDHRLDQLDARVAREFPSYAGLVSPEPLAAARVRELLRPDEALVVFLIRPEQSYAWVVRPAGLEMLELPAGRDELAADVAHLRLGLDPAGGRGVPQLEMAAQGLRGAGRLRDGRSVVGLFDVDRAHALYQKLWAPLEPYLEGVARVVVVPDGPLESLPLQVLVTEAPEAELEEPEELRGVAWLVRRPYALNVLPAVGALRALRELAPNTPPGAAFLGFGDPLIGGAPAADCREPAPEELVVAELTAEAESWPRRGVEAGPADLFRGGGWRDGVPVADATAVRRLPRLPDSRCELQALARSLGAGEDALHLGAAATEAAVKGLSAAGELRRAGVLAFATHGLVAGEFDGLAEPALVLTPPAAGTAEDDGLLTASEVAQLDLNTEWVLLSACNTAAADGAPGAEGLSGLARAFFYAGARALLVSHWSVYSPAAVALTTGTLERLRQEPGLGRAEALRQTMVELIVSGKDPHPAYWAPFVVVGEGASVEPSHARSDGGA